jgi:hypothetical protein
MVSVARCALPIVGQRNKIVFPWPIGNTLKDRFRNFVGIREENRLGRVCCSTPCSSAGDYSHSIVLGGFDEMS